MASSEANEEDWSDIKLNDGVTITDSVETRQTEQGSKDDGAPSSCSKKWTDLILAIRKPIKKLILLISKNAATHPKSYILGTITFSIILLTVGLLTNFNVDVDEDVLWTPDNSRALKHGNWIDDESGFPLDPRESLLLIHTDGNNVLGQEGVRRAFEALDSYRTTPGYEEICALYSTEKDDELSSCPVSGVTKFWNHSAAIFDQEVASDEDAILAMSATTYPDGTPVDTKSIIGKPERNENGTLTFGQVYILRVDLPAEDDPAEAFEDKVLDVCLDLQKDWDNEKENPFRLEIVAERSFSDEFSRAIQNDIPLVPIVFVVMATFTALVFWKRDWVYSRSLLGFGATVSVLLAIMSGYGLLFTIGVPFTSMTQILPFVMFGIGLDDAFIISGAYARTDMKKDAVERIHDTMDEVGISIFATTVTSVAAFGLGCISSIPAVYWLCQYAFPTILIDFIYQITFFVALIVVDEQRVKDKRRDCAVCCTVQNRTGEGEEEEAASESHAVDRFMKRYANNLLRPWVKAVVVLVFTALFGACAYSASELTEAFEFTDVLPNDSYITRFWEAIDGYSQRSGVEPGIYFRFVDQSDQAIQEQMESYVNDIVAIDEISDPPSEFWLLDFKNFIEENQELQELSFNEQMTEFLADPVFSEQYSEDIVRNEQGDVMASRVFVYMDNVDQEIVTEQIDALENQRRVSRQQLINKNRNDWSFFTFEGNYYIWEFYAVASDELILTAILGVVAVSTIGMMFIPHWSGVFFVGPMITVLYVDLMGFLQFAGLYINPVTYISLVMSIGLLVDFLMHVILRYFESSEPDREAKTKDMLQTMGSSILIGGISTFLGVMPLAFSTSEIFSTVFICFIGLVVIGVTHGLIFLPVLLSLVGPNVNVFAQEKKSKSRAAKFATQQTETTPVEDEECAL